MKKLLATTAVLALFAAPALAQDYNSDNLSALSGFYAGGFGGYSMSDMDGPAGTEFDVDGGDYGVFVGYKADALLDNTINKTGMGLNGAIEFHYAWSTADDSFAGGSIEKDNEWGVSFRPGISFLSDIGPYDYNPYGIIGYRRAEFEGSAAGSSADEDYNGFELGIGTELVAYGDYGVRLDYSQVWYGDENGFEPDEDDIRLGMAYHF